MRKLQGRVIFWPAAVVAIFAVIFAVYSFTLPVGFKMMKIRRGVKTIVSSNSPDRPEVVEANVTSFKRKGLLVYGYKKSYTYPDGYKSLEGYFILDIETQSVSDGLSEAQMWARIGARSRH